MTLNKVISAGSTKEAALYFDEVFPDDFFPASILKADEVVKEGRGLSNMTAPVFDDGFGPIVANLMPQSSDAAEQILKYNKIMAFEFFLAISVSDLPEELKSNMGSPEKIVESAQRSVGLPFKAKDLEQNWGIAAEWLSMQRSGIIRQNGFGNVPTWVNEDIFEIDSRQIEDNPSNTFLASMQGLKLIDASRLSWDQICEFRKDVKSRKALRDLRLFFSDSLKDREIGYIIDRLEQLQDENIHIAKVWGFETATKAFGTVLEEKSLAFSGIGAVAASMVGAPLPAIAAASLLVPVGRFALKVVETGIQAAKTKSTNPTKYLTMVSELNK